MNQKAKTVLTGRNGMVYCTKCGFRNPDEARYCSKCGADLEVSREERWEERVEKWGEEFGKQMEEWGEEFGKRVEEECFALPYGRAIVGAVFGVFLIIIGLALFLGRDIGQWIASSIAIVIGILIVAGAIYGLTRKKS
jgi:ribosomal protein L40E